MTESPPLPPKDVPWTLLGVSRDMMDEEFCNNRFPFRWRSSLAVSAYEPALSELPDDLCGQRITYLRVTSSITGYQPSERETALGYAGFGNVPLEELNRILGEYFACYGAQLNVAVFPGPRSDVLETRDRVAVTFADDPAGTALPNPVERADVTFEQPGEADVRVIDNIPPGGDGNGELDIRRELVVSCPPTDRVEVTVAHTSVSVWIEVFAGGLPVGTDSSGPERGVPHVLAVTGNAIDRVVVHAPEGEASLLEFAYFVVRRTTPELEDYPHIVDFEPKNRELVQAATETGELLTASKSTISTGKSLTHTDTSETGLELAAKVVSGKNELTGKLSHKWGETDVDAHTMQADAARERSEKQGTSTNISQLYNLLSGYHVGTNRAVFLMLPRPHILQPTDRRTFVQGLRIIEGVQEFFLVVTRPAASAGMCLEVSLETGHFPEKVETTEPEPVYDESAEDFEVTAHADDGLFSGDTTNIESSTSASYVISQGWVIDRRPGKGDPGHPGVSEIANNSNGQANSSLTGYNYQATSDASVQVSGKISGESAWRDEAHFRRTYRVFTRSERPKETGEEPTVTTPFLITARSLCLCYRSTEHCPVPVRRRRPLRPPPGDWIVDEPVIVAARDAALRDTLRQIRFTMARSARMPSRRDLGDVGFLESDYFGQRIAPLLDRELASRLVQPDVERPLVQGLTIGQLLSEDLLALARRTGSSRSQLSELRRDVIGRLTEGGEPAPPDATSQS